MLGCGHGSHSKEWQRDESGKNGYRKRISHGTSTPGGQTAFGGPVGRKNLLRHKASIWPPLGTQNLFCGCRRAAMGFSEARGDVGGTLP